MNNRLIVVFSLLILLSYSCSKGTEKENGPQTTTNSIKIEILTGNNAADTIGQFNSLTFSVTQNGKPLNGYTIYYHGSGCNADHIDSSVTFNGLAGYTWELSGEVGQQTLGVYALDTQHQKADSITATATGIAPATGWHQASCAIFPTLNPSSYCKLSTGRIFANFMNGLTYLRYSDDNGRSWYTVNSLGNTHEIEYVVSTPADEVFAFTFNEGVFYSSDAGQSWTAVNSQAFNGETILAAVYSPEGSLLVVTDKHPVSISTDKGKTWIGASTGQFVPTNPVQSLNGQDGFFTSPAEDAAGNLYVVADESQTIYKSANNGNSWSALPNDVHGYAYAFYIDKNNWFYKNISGMTYGGIYISKDNGNTYNLLFSAQGAEINNISLQSDGNLYQIWNGRGLFSENNITGNPTYIYPIGTNTFMNQMAYIVAKNNNIIVTSNVNINNKFNLLPSSTILYYQK